MMKKYKNEGFKVPDGYFDSFKERLMEGLSQSEREFPSDDGFAVPEGYFETLNGRIKERMKPAPKVIRLSDYRKYYLAAAAVAAVVLFYIIVPVDNSVPLSFNDLAGDDIASYMENSELDFSDDEISQLLPLQEIEISDMLEQRLGEEQIIEYLDVNMDEYEELNIEFND